MLILISCPDAAPVPAAVRHRQAAGSTIRLRSSCTSSSRAPADDDVGQEIEMMKGCMPPAA